MTVDLRRNWIHVIWGLLGYAPNEAQKPIVRAFLAGSRFLLLCGGEQAGKSYTSVAMGLAEIGPREGGARRLYWIVGPDYAQARAEFTYFYQALNEGGFISQASMPETKTQPWILKTIWNVTIETKTSSDITKLASFPVDGVLMVEAAQQQYETWLKLRGRVAPTRGWVILSGTLEKGLPWYGSLLRKWKGANADGGKSFSLPAWTNLAKYPGGRDDPEIKALEASFPADLFMERFGAEPRSVHGLVIPEFDYVKHVRELEVVEGIPVNLAVDPATHTYAVLFVQKVGLYTHVLDCVYAKNSVFQDVLPEVKGNRLWKLVDKRQGNFIDIAGTQRHANKSQVQLWQELAGVSFAWKYLPLQVTIDTVRYRLGSMNSVGEPLVYFSASLPNPEPGPDGSAMHLLSEFELWKWPDRQARQNEAPKPVDRANDGIKALGYWLVGTFGPSEQKRVKSKAIRTPYLA